MIVRTYRIDIKVLKESSTTQYQSVFFSLYNQVIKQLGSRAGYFHY